MGKAYGFPEGTAVLPSLGTQAIVEEHTEPAHRRLVHGRRWHRHDHDGPPRSRQIWRFISRQRRPHRVPSRLLAPRDRALSARGCEEAAAKVRVGAHDAGSARRGYLVHYARGVGRED